MPKLPVIACGLVVAAVIAAPTASHAQAVLTLDPANSLNRGGPSTIAINVSVKAKAVSFHRLYVKVRCKETIDLSYTPPPEEKDDKAKKAPAAKPINVKREEVLFEKEVPFTPDKEYAPGSTKSLSAQIDIPRDLPPTARGKYARIKWEAEVVGDVVNKFWDANSGWQEITVK
jgi:hypothetical protein